MQILLLSLKNLCGRLEAGLCSSICEEGSICVFVAFASAWVISESGIVYKETSLLPNFRY
jgi:hypothetical protein